MCDTVSPFLKFDANMQKMMHFWMFLRHCVANPDERAPSFQDIIICASPKSIYFQKSISIQPRTGPLKFAKS